MGWIDDTGSLTDHCGDGGFGDKPGLTAKPNPGHNRVGAAGAWIGDRDRGCQHVHKRRRERHFFFLTHRLDNCKSEFEPSCCGQKRSCQSTRGLSTVYRSGTALHALGGCSLAGGCPCVPPWTTAHSIASLTQGTRGATWPLGGASDQVRTATAGLIGWAGHSCHGYVLHRNPATSTQHWWRRWRLLRHCAGCDRALEALARSWPRR